MDKLKAFRNRIAYLGPGEVSRILDNLGDLMNKHAAECENCKETGCEEFISLLHKHTAARHRLGIN